MVQLQNYRVKGDFTDPLDGTYDDSPKLLTPDAYQSTPEMREKLMRNLIDEGILIAI